ncbi:hypothetical protein NliqN6_1029 [Naganishia liquefaciens]|uniref:Uncharacterized protein n=1 Tax=Naganishia liquefaciens TaxID=104408 RepID=A0A8H3YDU8_9TREE|nr:hypothetical protein NliqN6_1029 [Naganishia liquefaciens]
MYRHSDNAASVSEPESYKSVGQKVMDTVDPEKYVKTTVHDHSTDGHATVCSKPGVVTSVTNAVKDTVNDITGSVQYDRNNSHNM